MADLNAGFPIIDKEGKMANAFREEMSRLALLVPITGTGSPEGLIKARLFQVYLDEAGSAGNIEYRKMLSEIGGDILKGWIQV